MTIAAGTKLGPYEISGAIGAGGMGEVYQAHDTKLGRDVAIKILPEAFAHDPERLSRFQREAKMLAALNHPNIATIYGLEESNGTSYLVMELVSGETLADRIKGEGAFPIDEALKIAVQIAEALEAAHERGIIHRDLKPANVKVTPDGKVKVLDFGLAKAFAGDGANEDPSNSPTLSMAATMHGVILGTAAYMSPEQARGKAVDKRTDIWAFGCVLYEELTGRQAFQGETVTDILAKVLQGEPDWELLPRATPLQIRDLLRRCLQKDKTLRLRDAGDARIEIQEALSAQPESVVARAFGRRQVAALGLAAAALLAIAGIAVWNLKPAPSPPLQPVTRTVITLPPGDQLAAVDYPAIAISPDGTKLAYVATHSGRRQIYLRPLDLLEAKPLPGTEGANTPFFSPDGRWLGFFADGRLKKISLSGGAALSLVNTINANGASWSSQGVIAFTPTDGSPLQQVSNDGGTQTPLTRLETGEVLHRWPHFLPSGKAVLFAATGTNPQIAVQSLETGQRKDLVSGGTSPQYVTTGHLLYGQNGNLMAAPFDLERLEVKGAFVPVVAGILQTPGRLGTQCGVSATGSLVYVPGEVQSTGRLVWVDRNGSEQVLAAPPRVYRYPRLSPDGKRMAVSIEEHDVQIWLYDIVRETMTRLTLEGTFNMLGDWAPDGKRIAYYSNREGQINLFWRSVDGSSGPERLTTSENIQGVGSFSPDGQALAFVEPDPSTGMDLWMLHMSDRQAKPFLRTPFNEGAPRFSPDGHFLAYFSNESGRYEVYVQPYPGPGAKWQISTEGGTEPVWNPKGRELFYREGERMMAVDIVTQPDFSASKPRMLFQGAYAATPGSFAYYDVSQDGQRFLMIKPEQTTSFTQIVVVQNWFEELKRRVPTGK